MTMRRAVVICMVAVGHVMAGSSTPSAQSAAEERDAIAAHIARHSHGSILRRTPVLDAPFFADAVMTWRPPANSGRHDVRGTTRYYRDRQGRVRVEQAIVGHARGQGSQRVIVDADLNKPWAYQLDPIARTATRIARLSVLSGLGGAVHFVLPVTMTCVIDLFRPGLHRPVEEEWLGERTMHGVQVEGTRVSGMLSAPLGPGSTIDERWYSPELKAEMYARSEDDQIGVVEYRVTTITRAEPAAALFEVPADYTLDSYQGATALNPYRPELWPTSSPSVTSRCGPATPPGF